MKVLIARLNHETNTFSPGVGIRFPSDEKSRQLKARIEAALGGSMASDRPTQTI